MAKGKRVYDRSIMLALIYDPTYNEYENDYMIDVLGLEGDETSSILDVINAIKNQYKEIETSIEADGNEHSFQNLSNVRIIQEKSTGKYFKLEWAHDSWSDGSLSDSNPSMVEVQKVTKTVDTYK